MSTRSLCCKDVARDPNTNGQKGPTGIFPVSQWASTRLPRRRKLLSTANFCSVFKWRQRDQRRTVTVVSTRNSVIGGERHEYNLQLFRKTMEFVKKTFVFKITIRSAKCYVSRQIHRELITCVAPTSLVLR